MLIRNRSNPSRRPALLLMLPATLLLAAAGCKQAPDTGAKPAEVPAAAKTTEATAPAEPASEPAAATLRDGEVGKLAALLGDWSGDGTLEAGGEAHPVKSTLTCQVARGGVAVTCVHEAAIEGMGTLIETMLFGFDPVAKKFHWYDVNTMGETHDHVGTFTSPTHVDWTFEGTSDGKPLVERIGMDTAADSMSFRSETKVGGERQALFEGTLRK
jgi:hypothetical protein